MITRPLTILLLSIGLWFVSWVFVIGTIIMLLDIFARFREWLFYREMEWHHGIGAWKLRKSWCGRGVAVSIWPEAKAYYHQLGYRWWHILPDGAPGVFLRPQFWKTVIGV